MTYSMAYLLQRSGKHGFPVSALETGEALALARKGFARLAGGRLYATPEGLAAVRALPYPTSITMPETSSRPKAPARRRAPY
jgi:hypothetical protein